MQASQHGEAAFTFKNSDKLNLVGLPEPDIYKTRHNLIEIWFIHKIEFILVIRCVLE